MNSVIDTSRFSPEDQRRLKKLTGAPPVAWFTVIVSVAIFLSYVAVIGLGTVGALPLWLGCIINAALGYLAFTPTHEGLHRAISQNERFNDFICQLGVLVWSPSADQRMFRWVHILHHRFGLGPEDPDHELKGAWWTLPLRWMFLDVIYLTYVVRSPSKIATPYLHRTIRRTIVLATVIIALCVAGFGMEVLMLWFISACTARCQPG